MKTICQLYPTIITPFNDDLSIDYLSLERLIQHYATQKCDGIFAVCQSSEMFFLSDDEKIELADFSIKSAHKYGIKCVVSGHTQDDIASQIRYLKKLEQLKPDAVILVNNRLAREDEDEDVALENLSAILQALDKTTRLGVYECPHPYKRAFSDRFIRAIVEDGRFDFIKDTCCKAGEIKHRLALLEGSCTKLYNANAATLYETLKMGAYGYSGVMLNMISGIFKRFKEALSEENTEKAAFLSDLISAGSIIEYQNYPVNAKHILKMQGLIKTTKVRNGKPELTESQRKETEAFLSVMETACRKLQ